VAGDAHAEELTLATAIGRGIAQNPEVELATIAVAGADAREDATEASFGPVVEVTTSVRAQRDQPWASLYVLPIASDRLVATASVGGQRPGGLRYQLGAVASIEAVRARVQPASSSAEAEQTVTSPRLEVRVDQPLAAGRVAGRARLAAAAAECTAARHERAAVATAIVSEIERAYLRLAVAERELEIREELALAADAQLRQVQVEVEHGARPPLTATEIEEEAARRREEVLVARGGRSEASIALALLLGMTPTTDLRAIDPLAPPATDAEVGQVARADMPERAAIAARTDAARAEVARVDDETGWRVDVYAAAALAAPRDDVVAAAVDTLGYGGWSVEVGISLRIPVGASGRRAQLAAARAQVLAGVVELSNRDRMESAEALRISERAALARERGVALARTIELAEANVRAEAARWERGDTTAFELLRRQAALGEARLRYLRALADQSDAEIDRAVLAGTVLRRHAIELR